MKRSFLYFLLCLSFIISAVNVTQAASPTRQARYLTFSSVSNNSATITWINGNGTNRMVVIKENNNTWTNVPATIANTTVTAVAGPTNYATATAANDADMLGVGYTDGGKVVYNGSGGTRSVTVTNLNSSTTYYVMVIEYNVTGGSKDFINSSSTNNPRTFTTLATTFAAPTAISAVANSEGAQLTWTPNAGATGYYLDVYDVTGSAYLPDWVSADIGNANSIWLMGLTASRNYQFRLRSYSAAAISSPSDWVNFTTTATPAFAVAAAYSPVSGNVAKIGDVVTITVTTNPLQTGLNLGVTSVNNETVPVSVVEHPTDDGKYVITYTVVEGDADIADGADLPVSMAVTDNNAVAATYTAGVNNAIAPGVDATRPTVTGVASSTVDGAYGVGEQVNLGVTFSENVNFVANGGTAELVLELGATDHNAVANADQASVGTVNMSYTVATGDVAADLDYVATNSFSLTGSATIKDLAGNTPAALTLPATGTFAGAHAIVVDGVVPTATAVVAFIDVNNDQLQDGGDKLVNTTDKILNQTDQSSGDRLVMIGTFDSNMDQTGGLEPTLTFTPNLVTGGTLTLSVANSAWVDATHYRWEYTITDNNVELAGVDLGITGAKDVAGNTMDAYSSTDVFSVDLVAPTVTITRNGTNYITNADAVSFDVAFSEDMAVATLTVGDDFTSVYTGTVTSDAATLDADAGPSKRDFTYNITNIAGDGDIPLALINNGGASAVTDLAGNTVAAASTAADGVFTIDNIAPTVTVTRNAITLGEVGAFKTSDNSVSFNLDFSEQVKDFTVADLQIDGASVATGVLGALTVDNLANGVYTQTVTTVAGDGVLGLQINAAGFTDLAGNPMAADFNTAQFTIDNTPATIAAGSTLNAATNKEFYIDVTFNPASGLYPNTNKTGILDVNQFNVSVDAGANGVAGISGVAVSRNNSATYSTPANDLVGGESVVRVFFDVDGTPNGDESITITPANATSLYDDAGNPMSIAQTTGLIALPDQTAPKITNISDGGATYVKSGSTVTITFNVEDIGGITHPGTVHPTVNVRTSANVLIGSATFSTVSGTGVPGDLYLYTYTYTVPGSTYSNVRITAQATDDALNVSSTEVLLNAFNIDNTPPTQAAVTYAANGGTPVANAFNSTNTDVTLTVPIANDATLNGGTFKIQYRTDDANDFATPVVDWTDVAVGVIPIHTISDVNTTVPIALTEAQFKALVATEGHFIQFRAVTTDVAGNPTDGTASASIKLDETLPTLSVVHIVSNNPGRTAYARAGDVVTLSFNSSETVGTPTVAFKSNTIALTNPHTAVTEALLTLGQQQLQQQLLMLIMLLLLLLILLILMVTREHKLSRLTMLRRLQSIEQFLLML